MIWTKFLRTAQILSFKDRVFVQKVYLNKSKQKEWYICVIAALLINECAVWRPRDAQKIDDVNERWWYEKKMVRVRRFCWCTTECIVFKTTAVWRVFRHVQFRTRSRLSFVLKVAAKMCEVCQSSKYHQHVQGTWSGSGNDFDLNKKRRLYECPMDIQRVFRGSRKVWDGGE